MSTLEPNITSEDSGSNRFGAADYGVFAAMLAISAIIGIYYAFKDRKTATTQDFLMGNRSMGVFPVALSLLASFLSAVTLLGLPAEIYTFGTQYWIQVITYPLIMFITAYFFIPVFYSLGLTSSFEVNLNFKFKTNA
jgi:sodium-coupled monocarboxylate transporter 8/12